jgi:hypothetical protein
MLSKRQEIYHLIKGSLPSGKGKYPFLSAVRPNFIELKTTVSTPFFEPLINWKLKMGISF